ncbi:hypothetical protein BU16DRAFT_70931 [Lophium mytilinum]|uniref:Aminoglycoside phosphotransferase domain-containing protein n=1 Tax=Lophium mytilinum TaxID=390894 RepID=A0A6A6QQ92_9PEZI|nr:hypothetical protein BU16DRAFT_70931 [Lophium mytilinum]
MGPTRPSSFDNLVSLTKRVFHRSLYFGDDRSESSLALDRGHSYKDREFDALKWGPILSIPDEAALEVALAYRRRLYPELEDTDEKFPIAEPSDITAIVKLHAEGFNNRAFIIRYNDGWDVCVRIPACGWGDNWSEMHAKNFLSQACTVRYIRENSQMRIPDMLHVNNTLKNAMKAPYMIMTAVDGRDASHVWFEDDGLTPAELEAKRQHILKTLAEGVSALRHLKFDKMGTLHFPGGFPISLEKRISTPYVGESYNRNFGWLPDKTGTHKHDAITPPYATSQEWLRYRLDQWWKETCAKDKKGASAQKHHEHKGIYMLFAMMFDYFPFAKADPSSPEPFVLAPPDFDWQNTLVADDGTVTAFIDWDRAETLPIYLGWPCYPNFLSADWRVMYEWPAKNVMSPSHLASYREDYARYMKEACGTSSDAWRYTRKSHFFSALEFAVGDAKLMEEVLFKILELLVPRTRKDEHILRLGAEGYVEAEEEWLRAKFKELFAC